MTARSIFGPPDVVGDLGEFGDRIDRLERRRADVGNSPLVAAPWPPTAIPGTGVYTRVASITFPAGFFRLTVFARLSGPEPIFPYGINFGEGETSFLAGGLTTIEPSGGVLIISGYGLGQRSTAKTMPIRAFGGNPAEVDMISSGVVFIDPVGSVVGL